MPLPDERGFTLLEVMIALAILALGLTAAFRLQVEDLTVTRRAAQNTRACLAAESAYAQWQVSGLPEKGSGRPADLKNSGGMSLTWEAKSEEGHPGLERVAITIRAGDGGQWDFERLMLRREQ